MNFIFHRPVECLRPYVRYYWVLKTNDPIDVVTFPIGCPQLIFHRGKSFYIPELQTLQAKFSVSGQVNFPARIQANGGVETVVVVFQPHSIAPLFNIPVFSFYNREIDGYGLGDKELNVLADDVLNCDDSNDAVCMIEKWLLARISEEGICNFNRVDSSLKQLLIDKSVSVERMAQKSCLSRKQFERVFSNVVGMNPKEYSNIVRFQRSLWLFQNKVYDLADISYSCGYSDQSHFIRECRRFSGFTPTQLLKIQPVYSDLFASPF